MGRKKSPKNQAVDAANIRQQRQQAFDIMRGFDEVLEPFSEEERQVINEAGERASKEVRDHRAELVADALKEQQELAMMDSEHEVARAQFLQNFPQMEARLRAIEGTGKRRRDDGLMSGVKQGDISRWV